ncbi:hypothetical protein KCP69_20570 [Salmonella enterica subsp. enterica]|nr:hypothetical protein KCP69_20570 [Salmonella enterica subsp. enterica]
MADAGVGRLGWRWKPRIRSIWRRFNASSSGKRLRSAVRQANLPDAALHYSSGSTAPFDPCAVNDAVHNGKHF